MTDMEKAAQEVNSSPAEGDRVAWKCEQCGKVWYELIYEQAEKGNIRGDPIWPVMCDACEAIPWIDLPSDQMFDVLASANKHRLFVSAKAFPGSEIVSIVLATGKLVLVPFSALPPVEGKTPDFTQLSLTDFGLTLKLGEYEASSDDVLHEASIHRLHHVAQTSSGMTRSEIAKFSITEIGQ